MPTMQRIPKRINRNSTGAAVTNTTANVETEFFTWTIQKGLGVLIRDPFNLTLRIPDSSNNQLPGTAELRFAARLPSDQRARNYVSSVTPFVVWNSLSLANQMNLSDFGAQTKFDLKVPDQLGYLPLQQDEVFVLTVFSTVAADILQADLTIQFEYEELSADEIKYWIRLRNELMGF